MVSPIVFDYLKENYGKHDLNALKRKIIAGGYTEDEYNDALMAVKLSGYKTEKKKGRLSFILVILFSAIAIISLIAFFLLS